MKIFRSFIFLTAVTSMFALSCNKEDALYGSADSPASVVSFKASTEIPSNRTAIDASTGKVTWVAGDQVVFYWQVAGEYHKGDDTYPYRSQVLTEESSEVDFLIHSASETFVNAFVNNQKPASGGRNLYAIYPASAVSSYYMDASHKALDVVIPERQDGRFGNSSIALAKWGSANPAYLKFRNLCALLKVHVTDDNVRSIMLKNDSYIAGRMQLTFEDDPAGDYPVVAKVLDGKKSITIDVAGTGEYYIAVRPTDMDNLYIEYRNEAGVALAGRTAASTLSVKRSYVYELSGINAPTDKIFVKTVAAGDGSGSSWDNAMTLDALATHMATKGVVSKKVYMAAGTYFRKSAIQVKTTGFEIYGGYPANAAGYDLTGRDIKANATIIDGGWGDASNDVYARIFLFQAGEWVLDGLVFQNIKANNAANGSAVQVISTEGAVIRNCSFINCENANPSYSGGAVRIDAGNTVDMISCSFSQNLAQNGGAVYVAGILNATDCEFADNTASVSGGAIMAMGSSVVKMDNCRFSLNDAEGLDGINGGGAVYMDDDARLYLNRCYLVRNTDKYNAHHIYTRSSSNWVGLNNCVVAGPFGVATDAGSLLQLKGLSAIVNTTIYCRTRDWGAISLGSKTTDGCRVINDIVINSSSTKLSFYTTAYSMHAYNTIYTDYKIKSGGAGTYDFSDCISGADCLSNFPKIDYLWKNYEDMLYEPYVWDGTTDLGTIRYSTISGIKTLIRETAVMGEDFLGWLESNSLKVNGTEALAVDIRGEARDTEKMWPGSYQQISSNVTVEYEGNAENFNIK